MESDFSFDHIRQELDIALEGLYDERERTSVIAVYLEDRFGVRSGQYGRIVNATQKTSFFEDLPRLKAGEPVQYVVGKAPFFGFFFTVDPNVLIPRPETEELVATVLQRIRDKARQKGVLTILDVGTGSGCIAISLKKAFPQHRVLALDISKEALTVARKNAIDLAADIEFLHLDIIDRERWKEIPVVDLIVSNPPYVAYTEIQQTDLALLAHEPALALYPPGDDVMLFYRILVELSQKILASDGEVWMEINALRKNELEKMFSRQQGLAWSFNTDMQGKYRVAGIWKC